MKIMLARIEERQEAQAEASAHRHANLKQELQAFVPRREIEQANETLSDKIKASHDAIIIRVVRLEEAQTWFVRKMLMASFGSATIGSVAAAVTAKVLM